MATTNFTNTAAILNSAFTSSDSALVARFKPEAEIFNLIYNQDENALNVSLVGTGISGVSFASLSATNFSADTIILSGTNITDLIEIARTGDTVVAGGTNVGVTVSGGDPKTYTVNLDDDITLNSVLSTIISATTSIGNRAMSGDTERMLSVSDDGTFSANSEVVSMFITSGDVISNIEDVTSWDGEQFYSGSTSGLIGGQSYFSQSAQTYTVFTNVDVFKLPALVQDYNQSTGGVLSAITGSSISQPENSVMSVETKVTAREAGNANVAFYNLQGLFKRDASNTIQIGSTVSLNTIETDVNYDCDFATGLTSVLIVLTGATGANTDWIIETHKTIINL